MYCWTGYGSDQRLKYVVGPQPRPPPGHGSWQHREPYQHAPLTAQQEARMLELSRMRQTSLAERGEFSCSIEELGRTDPDRALEIYAQWYLEVEGAEGNPGGVNEGEVLRAHFRNCLACCHEKNQGKHWDERDTGLNPYWVFCTRST